MLTTSIFGMDSAFTFHLATIQFFMGTLNIYWNPEQKHVRYVCGTMIVERANEPICASLSQLMGAIPDNLETRKLILYEGWEATHIEDDEKMAKDLLNCYWSDYAMDRMYFRVHLAIGHPALREQQFDSMIGNDNIEDDPQPIQVLG